MRIYLSSERAKAQPRHTVHVAPGAQVARGDGPAEWWGHKGEPVTIAVPFAFGAADVPAPLGAFMVAHGYAVRTSLILPAGVALAA